MTVLKETHAGRPDGEIDVPVVRTLLEACGGAPVTVHRLSTRRMTWPQHLTC
jgi:copper homeostasis protein CutC